MLKNKMKMSALVLMLTIMSMFVAPKKSEAGIVLILTAGGGAPIIGVTVLVTGGIVSTVGLLTGIADADFVAMLAFIVLDADGSLPSDKLVTELSKKYSFIENREVIENLVSGIKEKAGKLSANEKKYVSFNSAEVDSFLSSMDTTGLEKEIIQMKKDLE